MAMTYRYNHSLNRVESVIDDAMIHNITVSVDSALEFRLYATQCEGVVVMMMIMMYVLCHSPITLSQKTLLLSMMSQSTIDKSLTLFEIVCFKLGKQRFFSLTI